MEGLGALHSLIDLRLAADKAPVILALDGPCGGGKTTLAAGLAARYPGSAVIHTDDFFLRPFQRTPRRLLEPGGNMDRERLADEVLLKLPAGLPFKFSRYDCRMDTLTPVWLTPGRLNIVEGSYSLHPELREHYTLKVFLDADRETQLKRLAERLGEERLADFVDRWMPLEYAYFDEMNIRKHCDLMLRT